MCYVCFFNGHISAAFIRWKKERKKEKQQPNQRRIPRELSLNFIVHSLLHPLLLSIWANSRIFIRAKQQAGFKSKRFRYWIWRTRWHKVIFFPLIFFFLNQKRNLLYAHTTAASSGHCNYSHHPPMPVLIFTFNWISNLYSYAKFRLGDSSYEAVYHLV